MPLLKDTEWRVLCVIVRQTIGWLGTDGQPKTSDWITRRQFMERTGRHAEAISEAVAGLIEKRLIRACDEAGNLLSQPSQRRNARGRIQYGLHPNIWNIPQKIRHGDRKSELDLQPRMVEKANTTKENLKEKSDEPRLSLQENAAIRLFEATYAHKYRSKFAVDPTLSVLTEDERVRLHELIALHGARELEAMLGNFFSRDWAWLRKSRFSLAAFLHSQHLLRLLKPSVVGKKKNHEAPDTSGNDTTGEFANSERWTSDF